MALCVLISVELALFKQYMLIKNGSMYYRMYRIEVGKYNANYQTKGCNKSKKTSTEDCSTFTRKQNR